MLHLTEAPLQFEERDTMDDLESVISGADDVCYKLLYDRRMKKPYKELARAVRLMRRVRMAIERMIEETEGGQ